MKNNISDRAAGVGESATLAFSMKAKKMQEQGEKVINLTVGEPDFNTPGYIIAAAKKALDEGKTKYTATGGVVALRTAICDKLKRDNGLVYTPGQIVVANGAKQAIFNATMALVNPGDEVIIIAPYWVTYPELVKFAGGVPVVVETRQDNGFKITQEQISKAITKKTKAIIINSPNNPTGAVYSELELRALAGVIEKADIWVISDEIYENLIYNGKHWSIASHSDKMFAKTIVVNGMSKTYSMTGWRIGYTACSAEMAAAIENMQSHTTGNINTVTQYAGTEALEGSGGGKFLRDMISEFDKRRKYMVERLSGMSNITFSIPDGAFYVMVNVGKIGNGKAIAMELLDKAKLAVVPGEAFGAPDYIRLCYTVSMADIKAGLDALEVYLKQKK